MTAALCWLRPPGWASGLWPGCAPDYRAFFHEEMATLADDELQTLVDAIEILDKLIERLA